MLAALALIAMLGQREALAAEKTGKEVVDSACIACHGSGVKGAPRIGDAPAWSKLESQGLSSLTANALKGIRQMPAHGGNPGLSDFEIERAITYMVNQSGGHWTEPINKASAAKERTGEQIVRAQCAKCHQTGVDGAPKIGDRAAWVPRVKQGLDVVVRSAINGHGGMPARGGVADLTDTEIRSAVVYMFNAGTVPQKGAPAAAGGGEDYRVVEGMTLYVGVVSASVIREHAKDYPADVAGAVPSGAEQRYITIAVFDANNGQRITDAVLTARVAGTAQASPEKTLTAVTVAGAQTYGNFFPMPAGAYKITVHVHRPGLPKVVQADFQYKTQ